MNFTPAAGAFALDFAATLANVGVSDAIFLALSQFPSNDWPVLYTSDQQPTDIMLAFQDLVALNGTQVPCSGDGLSCIAVQASDGIHVLYWNFSWADSEFPTSASSESQSYSINVNGTVHTVLMVPDSYGGATL